MPDRSNANLVLFYTFAICLLLSVPLYTLVPAFRVDLLVLGAGAMAAFYQLWRCHMPLTLGLYCVLTLAYIAIAVVHLGFHANSTAVIDTLWLLALPSTAILAYFSQADDSQSPFKVLFLFFVCLLALLSFEHLTGFRLTATSGLRQAPSGFMVNPNDLGMFTVLLLGVALSLDPQRFQDRLLWIGIGICASLCVWLTQSRLALAALTLVLGFALWEWLTARFELLFRLVLACLCLALLICLTVLVTWSIFPQLHRYLWLALQSDPSTLVRWQFLEASYRVWDFSLVGAGPRNYQSVLQAEIANALAYRNLHAFLIEVKLAYGSIAWALFTALCFYPLVFMGDIRPKARGWLLLSVALVLISTFAPSSYFRYHYWLAFPFLVLAFGRMTNHTKRFSRAGRSLK